MMNQKEAPKLESPKIDAVETQDIQEKNPPTTRRRKRPQTKKASMPSETRDAPKPHETNGKYDVDYIEVTLRIPVMQFNIGSVTKHINLQSMTPKMRVACERIKRGCRAANVSIESGRPVVTGVDTTRYLFEQIASAMGITDEDVSEAFGGR